MPLEEPNCGIVRILNSAGDVAGTGFLVRALGESAPFLIVTAAHVVEEAGGTAGEALAFGFLATDDTRQAIVSAESYSPPTELDVAVLIPKGVLPAGVEPLVLGSAAATRDHSFCTFGFPAPNRQNGIPESGTIAGPVKYCDSHCLVLKSDVVTRGFSGAPVWDIVSQRVVGMIRDVTVPDELDRLNATAFATASDEIKTLSKDLQLSDVCPYRGLGVFTEEDVGIFFGRKRIVDDIVTTIAKHPRVTVVTGASGCGKSSIVRAGVVPALAQGNVPNSSSWKVFVSRPGSDPFRELSKCGFPGEGENLNARLGELRNSAQSAGHYLIVIDQFEELYVDVAPKQRDNFFNALNDVVTASGDASLVLVLRRDFLGRLDDSRLLELSRIVNVSDTLRREEVEDIARKPAEQCGISLDQGLLDLISTEAADRPGVLPLLEFALMRLWENRDEGKLTLKAYHAIGGVSGALSSWADKTFEDLSESEKPVVRRILLDLVSVQAINALVSAIRRERTIPQLQELTGEANQPQNCEFDTHVDTDIRRLVTRLADRRLLVTDRDVGGEVTVRLIHDELLRAWPLYEQWLKEYEPLLFWRQQIEDRISAWSESKDADLLLRRDELEKTTTLVRHYKVDAKPTEHAFLNASIARGRKRQIGWTIGIVVVIILFTIAGFSAYRANRAVREANQAARERQVSKAHTLFVQGVNAINDKQRLRARVLLAKSLTLHDSRDVRRSLAEVWSPNAIDRGQFPHSRAFPMDWHKDGTNCIEISQDGEAIITAGKDGRVLISNVNSLSPLAKIECGSSVTALARSPDGERIATGTQLGVVGVWDSSTGEGLCSHDTGAPILGLAFDSTGSQLAIGCEGTGFSVINVQSGDYAFRPVQGHGMSAMDIAFRAADGEGNWLFTASNGLWKVGAEGRIEHRFPTRGELQVVAISPDGRFLAVGGDHKEIRVLDASEGDHFELDARVRVADLEISADCVHLYCGTRDGVVSIWNLESRKLEDRLLDQGAAIVDLAISDDGTRLYSVAEDGSLRYWELRSGGRVVLRGGGETISAIGWIGKDHLVTANWTGDIDLWKVPVGTVDRVVEDFAVLDRHHFSAAGTSLGAVDVLGRVIMLEPLNLRLNESTGSGEEIIIRQGAGGTVNVIRRLPGKFGQISDHSTTTGPKVGMQIALGLEGRWRASHTNDGFVRLLDEKGNEVRRWSIGDETCVALSFAQNDRQIGIGTLTGKVIVFDAESDVRLGEFAHTDPILDVAFIPTSDGVVRIAFCSEDGRIRVWEVGDTEEERSFGNSVSTLTVAPAGKWLAYGDSNGSIHIVDLGDWEEAIRLDGHENAVTDLEFDSNGRMLASAGFNGEVIVFDLSELTRVQTAKASVLLSEAEADAGMSVDESTSGKFRGYYVPEVPTDWQTVVSRIDSMALMKQPEQTTMDLRNAREAIANWPESHPITKYARKQLVVAYEKWASHLLTTDDDAAAYDAATTIVELSGPTDTKGLLLRGRTALAVGNAKQAVLDFALAESILELSIADEAERRVEANYELARALSMTLANNEETKSQENKGSLDELPAEQRAQMALAHLQEAFELGFSDWKRLENDQAFAPLRGDERYQELLKRHLPNVRELNELDSSHKSAPKTRSTSVP